MDYRSFEQRLLDTIFTTDVPLNPATIAFLYKLSVQEASDLLQQAAVAGLLNIESDDEGNLVYIYPNRTKLPGREGAGGSQAAQAAAQMVRVDPSPPLVLQGEPLYVEERPAEGAQGAASGSAGTGMMRCPFCGEGILRDAKKCKHCHEYLDYALRDIHARGPAQVSVALQHGVPPTLAQWTGTQAALLSLCMPGLGQMCTGRVPAGLLWMMFTIMGYFCLIVPGFILHILCIINASRQPRQLT